MCESYCKTVVFPTQPKASCTKNRSVWCHQTSVMTSLAIHSPWKWRPYSIPKFIVKPTRFCSVSRVDIHAFANQNSVKKPRRRGRAQKDEISPPKKTLPNEHDTISGVEYIQDSSTTSSSMDMEVQTSVMAPSRIAVLQACTVTSFLIGALGVVIRQVSHFASIERLPVTDCSTVLPFSFEIWHVGLITGMVILVSSLRYLLLMMWPDFAESSEAANCQVLTQLEPLDYIVVAFLPGLTEELLFRGALLPLLGLHWENVFLVAALFGILHLGSGRKYSFAVWATFVGFVYGYAAISSSSIIVPMASHAVNNLVGGIIWRYTSTSSKLTE